MMEATGKALALCSQRNLTIGVLLPRAGRMGTQISGSTRVRYVEAQREVFLINRLSSGEATCRNSWENPSFDI